MRRAGVVLSFVAVAAAIVGCASVGHTWQDEFSARLEGAAGSLEEAGAEYQLGMSRPEYLRFFRQLSRTLGFKDELMTKLSPPEDCQAVQEKGEHELGKLTAATHGLPQNLTPMLERRLPQALKEEVARFEALEAEAASCGATS